MKTCPACKTQYSDDTLQFCLQDGTRLAGVTQSETPTVVLGGTETMAARGQGRMNVPINDLNSVAWPQSQVTHVETAIPPKKRSNTTIVIILAAVGMLVIFGVIVVAAIVFLRNSQLASISNADRDVNPPGVITNTNYNAIPTPTASRKSPTPGPTIAGNIFTAPPSTPVPTPPALRSYLSTTRLKFGRGAYSTSFTGDVNPGGTRSLVLTCLSGQSLSANVSSGGGCVTFRGGGGSIKMITNGGDNYLTLANSCSSVVHFTISISVV